MMNLKIFLNDDEEEMLFRLAEKDCRDMKREMKFLLLSAAKRWGVRQELRRQGLLTAEKRETK